MKKVVAGLLVLIYVLLISCASIHSGTISSGPLLSVNDRHIRTAIGSAGTTIVLGFGGTGYEALVHNAKSELEKNYPLAKGEYYANYTVDFKRTVYFFVAVSNEAFVHADIFTQNPTAPGVAVDDGNIKPEINFYKTKTDSFYVGERIYMNYDGKKQLHYSFNEFEIKGFDRAGFVYLKFVEKPQTTTVDRDLLYYSKDKTRSGYRAGDEITFKKGGNDVRGIILATAPNEVLISFNKGFYEKKYTEISK